MTAPSIPAQRILLQKSLCVVLLWVLAAGAQSGSSTHPATPSQAAGAGYIIAGTVVSKLDGHALGRTRITVRDTRNPQKFESMVTSDDGKFQFAAVPAGKYSLTGAKRGFISASYDQHDEFSTAIVTGAGFDTEALTLRLAPNAVIAGRVLDEFGEPVRRATVALYYDDHSHGTDQIHQFRGAMTDDQGNYEMTPLRPGTYFLSVSAKPWYAVHSHSNSGWIEGQSEPAGALDRSLDVAYPVTFYSDVTDAESATPIPIRGGERLQVDIHLNPVPALRLLFRVPNNESHGFTVPQLQQQVFDGTTYVQTSGVHSVSPGLVEVLGVPAGRYDIHMGGGGNGSQMSSVDLTKDGEEVDTSRAEATSSVKAAVQLPGETGIPAGLMIGLHSGHKFFIDWQAVDNKGEVQFPQVAAGVYEVEAQASGRSYSIAHMTAQGASISGHTLTVAAGSSPSISLTLVSGSVEVQGTAKKAGKAFAGAMVVLVPINPEVNRDLFRRDQSDLDGTFSLRNVVPGSYTLLAIENGWDLDWSQPGVIAAYLKQGQRVQVTEQNGQPMVIAAAIEVASK